MNHVYRLVWHRSLNALVPVAEIAGDGGKKSTPRHRRRVLSLIQTPLARAVLLALGLAPGVGWSLPSGGQVVAGQASLSQSGSTLTVNQSTDQAVVNWQSFGIAGGETVTFNQPGASSVALNRVLGSNASDIYGHLNANGQVFLVNPNGVYFAPGAQVNVGGIVASTLGISDSDFLNGNYHFSGDSTASVRNDGSITTSQGGYVAFIGNTVSNNGTITTPDGSTALGAGSSVDLTLAGNSLLSFQVSGAALNALAQNGGVIQADGGAVILSAQAKDALLQTVVNNTGVIQAQTVANHNGTIELLGGDSGTTQVAGTLDASAPNGGDGGNIETSGAYLKVADGTLVSTQAASGNTGTWLIDPVNFTIASSGGDITGNTLSNDLSNGSVTIQSSGGTTGTNGDINVNDAVTWSANTLTLNAQNNININANLNGSGTASLALQYGQGALAAGNINNYYLSGGASVSLPAGTNFSTKLGSDGLSTNWMVINSLGSAGSVTGTDLQGMAGDLTGNYALGANIDATATSGWNAGAGFAPVGNTATQFTGNFAGLGHTITGLTINRLTTAYVGMFGYTAGTLRDVGLLNSSISGQVVVGALAGRSNGAVSDSYVDGGSVTVDMHLAGGLVGQLAGSVSTSYATVVVNANSNGVSSTGIGGLVGQLQSGGSINNSYATGSVSGAQDVGGLVGQALSGGSISDSYATGAVSGTTYVGGLSGSDGTGTISATFTNSYWDTTTSGQSTSYGGTGLTTTQMQQQSSFSGWDFSNTWVIYNGHTNPLLRSFMYSLTVTADNASKTYDGMVYSGGNGVTYSVAPNANLLGTISYTGSSQGAKNVGVYAITPYGLYSNQQGYILSYANGMLTINNNQRLTDVNTTAQTTMQDGYPASSAGSANTLNPTARQRRETAPSHSPYVRINVRQGGVNAPAASCNSTLQIGTFRTSSGSSCGSVTHKSSDGS